MRIIPRIEIKNNFVIKGINLEGLRKIGDPNILGKKYYLDGADELLFMDVVASLYGRNNIFEIIKKITKDIFIPITVGGGIRNIEDIQKALNSGADKVFINSAAVKNPNFIKEAVSVFGSSTIVVSIETRKNKKNFWEIFIHNGREETGIELKNWLKKIQQLKCGEILITSIDNEGTRKGFDLDLLNLLKKEKISTPLIFCGGCGNLEHIKKIKKNLKDDAIAISSILHYNLSTIKEIKKSVNV
tara:strand:+ start:646 stop:1377 length:732 start_codon:yes stop_codon:yes gene_type:complete